MNNSSGANVFQQKVMSIIDNDDASKLVLRMAVGVLMLFHGMAKFGNTGTISYFGGLLSELGLPAFIAYGVYVGEILAPLMLIAGLYCRAGAVLIIINMLFAIMLVHMGDLFSLTEHGGWRLELQGFFLFGALAILFSGSGKYAIRPD